MEIFYLNNPGLGIQGTLAEGQLTGLLSCLRKMPWLLYNSRILVIPEVWNDKNRF
jgi:hypothetical protein